MKVVWETPKNIKRSFRVRDLWECIDLDRKLAEAGMNFKRPPLRCGPFLRAGLFSSRSQGPWLYCVLSNWPWALHFWSEPTTRMGFVRVTGLAYWVNLFLETVQGRITLCSPNFNHVLREPQGTSSSNKGPSGHSLPDLWALTWEGLKLKPLLGSNAYCFEITRRPWELAACGLYQQIRLDLLIPKYPGPCKKDPRTEIYGQFTGNSISYQF